jgi:hypothetical protein
MPPFFYAELLMKFVLGKKNLGLFYAMMCFSRPIVLSFLIPEMFNQNFFPKCFGVKIVAVVVFLIIAIAILYQIVALFAIKVV